MLGEEIRTLYRYNAWANARIVDTAESLSREQFLSTRGASFDSIRSTLVHTMSAQWLWLERWNGRSPTVAIEAQDFSELASIRTRWAGIERDTQAFLGGLSEARLAAIVEYRNTRGERWSYPLWQQMVHQVNHATQHRSEVAVMLTQLGYSPGDLDLLHYIDVLSATARAGQ